MHAPHVAVRLERDADILHLTWSQAADLQFIVGHKDGWNVLSADKKVGEQPKRRLHTVVAELTERHLAP